MPSHSFLWDNFDKSETILHSNAGAECVFSHVRLNKTPYRSCLGLDGTLSSILTAKMHDIEPCFNYGPPENMLKNLEDQLGTITRNI